jgi:plastocyanin
MKVRRGVAVVLGVAVMLSCFSDRAAIIEPNGADCTVPATAFGQNRIPVIIRQFTFLSDTVRIRPGGTVTWVNCEDPNVEPHTSTSTTGAWDSNLLQPGASFERTFPTAGTFPYFCRPHTDMRGVVIVQ